MQFIAVRGLLIRNIMYNQGFFIKSALFSLYCLTLSFTFVSVYLENEYLIFLCIFSFTLEIIVISFIEKNFTLLFFLFTFVFFQMSRIFLYYFGLLELDWKRGYVGDFFSKEVSIHTLKTFVIVLSALFFSQYLLARKNIIPNKSKLNIFNNCNKLLIKIVSIFLVVTLLFNIYKSYDVFRFIRRYGYISYYRDYVGNRFVDLFADLSYIFFYFYLALTAYKQVRFKKIVLFLFIIASFLVLIQGTRRFFVLNILLVLYFYLVTKKSFSLKFVIKLIFPVFALFVLLFVVNSVRMGRTNSKYLSFSDIFILFLNQQGVSIVIPSYGYVYNDQIPDKGLNYLFPDQIKLVQNILGTKIDKSNRIEQAIDGNYLAQFISYKVMPSRFEKGEGMGGSFILEIYYYFGYFGLFLFSLLIGFFTKYACRLNLNFSTLSFVILLSIIHYLFLIPRSYPTQIFFNLTSLKFWFVFFMLFSIQTIITYIKPKKDYISGKD